MEMTDLVFEDCEKLGFDRARLEALPAYYDSYLGAGKFAGLSLLVARGGKIAQFSHRGTMGFDRDEPVDEASIFRIYSMTKPITSVAIMQLYEQARVLLTVPVHREGRATRTWILDPEEIAQLADWLAAEQ